MKTLGLTAVSFLFATLGALAGDGWMTDLDAAFEKAKEEKKPVLVEFTGSDWCPPCKMMAKEVFSKKEFIEKASQDFILVELDFPNGDPELKKKNQSHADEYEVSGFPTIILFDHDQREFSRFIASKYPTVEKFLGKLKKALDWKDLE